MLELSEWQLNYIFKTIIVLGNFYILLFEEFLCFSLKFDTIFNLGGLILVIPVLQMDGVISQAQATLGALVFQRSTFGGINSKLSNVSSRLPTV